MVLSGKKIGSELRPSSKNFSCWIRNWVGRWAQSQRRSGATCLFFTSEPPGVSWWEQLQHTWFSGEHLQHCRTKTSDMQMGTSVADAITSRSCTMSIRKPINLQLQVWPGWNYGMVSCMDHVEFTMIGDHSSSSTLCNPCFNCPCKLMDPKALKTFFFCYHFVVPRGVG